MPLTGKYLKYNSNITFEIFENICNKLIKTGLKASHNENIKEKYNNFKSLFNYLELSSYPKCFECYERCSEKSETTVQEILGYDPFVKDDFVLPKKWCIKHTDNKELHEFFENYNHGGYSGSSNNFFHYPRFNGANCLSLEIKSGYIEITFDQFKKYVLKDYIEIPKETEPQYVKCIDVATCNTKVGEIFKCRYLNGCFEFEYNDKSKENFNSWDGWGVPWSDKLPQKYFKHSTKEAFDAQNKPIEKWSAGSYFVIEKDRLYNISSSKRGDICIIKKDKTFNFINKKDQTNWSFYFREGSSWFATKSEAEEFAKTLVEEVKEEVKTPQLDLNEWLNKYKKLNLAVNDLVNAIELSNFDKVFLKLEGTDSKEKANILYDLWNPKQPLRQAVHCKTQEEWDFAKVLIGKIDGVIISKYDKISCCLNLNGETRASLDYYKSNNFQILSFQEWCDLNGYKMEKEVKSNQEFKVGDYITITKSNKNWVDSMDKEVGETVKITSISAETYIKYTGKPNWSFGARDGHFRHATPEEINNHLISIGQIPAGEPLNSGLEPNKDGMFKYTTGNSYDKDFSTSIVPGPLKMTLSIDDEELPMVNIIKTKTVNLLNLE